MCDDEGEEVTPQFYQQMERTTTANFANREEFNEYLNTEGPLETDGGNILADRKKQLDSK